MTVVGEGSGVLIARQGDRLLVLDRGTGGLFTAIFVLAHLRSGDHDCAGLDGTSAHQNVPMIAARWHCECSRDGNHW